MAKASVTFDEQTARRILAAVRRVEASGPPPANLTRRGAGPMPWLAPRCGVVVESWLTGQADPNLCILNPCRQDGSEIDTTTERTIYIQLPTDSTPADASWLTAETIVAYLPMWDVAANAMRGVLLGTAGWPARWPDEQKTFKMSALFGGGTPFPMDTAYDESGGLVAVQTMDTVWHLVKDQTFAPM